MKKFVLDTNIILHPDFKFEDFEDAELIIPIKVVEELDRLKTVGGTKGFRARKAIRGMSQCANVQFCLNDFVGNLPESFDGIVADNKILATAYIHKADIVTNDLNMQLKARALKIETHEFIPAKKVQKGFKELYLDLQDMKDSSILESFYTDPSINPLDLVINEYLIVYNKGSEEKEIDEKALIDLFKWTGTLERVEIRRVNNPIVGKSKPRNVHQIILFDIMQDTRSTIKLALGKFGTGKDYCQIINSFDLIDKQIFKKIIWIRNVVEVKDSGEIGALPGSSDEKLAPWAMPMADKVGGIDGLYRLIDNGTIELQHLSTIRGRDFKDSILYCTEIENMTKEQIQLVIGRVGEGSVLVLNGDSKQVDKDVFKYNGGIEALLKRLPGHKNFAFVELEKVERSDTAAMADLLD